MLSGGVKNSAKSPVAQERHRQTDRQTDGQTEKPISIARKVKDKAKCIYIALIFVVHARRSGMDHTVLPTITPMPAFTS